MITDKDFLVKEDLQKRVIDTSHKALIKWGEEGAIYGLMEEMAELNLELSRIRRGRHNSEDILEELVDVYMCVIEAAMIYGVDRFNDMLKTKIDKFEKQVNKDEE